MTYKAVRNREIRLRDEMKATGLNRSELVRTQKIIAKIEKLPIEAYDAPAEYFLSEEASKEYSILLDNENWLKITEAQKAYFQSYFAGEGWSLIKISTPNTECKPMLRFFLKGLGEQL